MVVEEMEVKISKGESTDIFYQYDLCEAIIYFYDN